MLLLDSSKITSDRHRVVTRKPQKLCVSTRLSSISSSAGSSIASSVASSVLEEEHEHTTLALFLLFRFGV